MRQPRIPRIALLTAALGLLAASAPALGEGQIIRLETGERVPFAAMVARLAEADVVLVGERHDDFAQHRAQREVITGLLARRPVAVGMEAFPAAKNAVLSDWRRGQFPDWPTFLTAVDWFDNWRVAPELYRPILETVRHHWLPLTGMNVPREWISRIAREGMAGLGEEQRQRIGPVAAAPEAYAESLRESLARHAEGRKAEHFIAAQRAWDAAMAGALLDLRRAHGDAVVIGLAGSGHIRDGYGIPHQLHNRAPDLEVRTVLPFDPEGGQPEPGAAAYAWPVAPDRAPDPVRIGARLGNPDGGPGISVVGLEDAFPGAKAGLEAGDRITAVDGREVSDATELIYRIRRHQWGGCLRLRVRREDQERGLTVPLNRPPGAGSR
ncbi:ChaN family lipoprotein [Thiohalorhabdus sp.]|uniref:ChaN family lipoprotein n=1 Tax=Thiohalorhabdus sp. TaxID=3094134 RepID=UPI002FC3B238